jgi:hypothetical protein
MIYISGLLLLMERKSRSVLATGGVQQRKILWADETSYTEPPTLWHLSGNSKENYEKHQSLESVFWPRFEWRTSPNKSEVWPLELTSVVSQMKHTVLNMTVLPFVVLHISVYV